MVKDMPAVMINCSYLISEIRIGKETTIRYNYLFATVQNIILIAA